MFSSSQACASLVLLIKFPRPENIPIDCRRKKALDSKVLLRPEGFPLEGDSALCQADVELSPGAGHSTAAPFMGSYSRLILEIRTRQGI